MPPPTKAGHSPTEVSPADRSEPAQGLTVGGVVGEEGQAIAAQGTGGWGSGARWGSRSPNMLGCARHVHTLEILLMSPRIAVDRVARHLGESQDPLDRWLDRTPPEVLP